MSPPVTGDPLTGPRSPRVGAARVGPGGVLPSAAPARPVPEARGGAGERGSGSLYAVGVLALAVAVIVVVVGVGQAFAARTRLQAAADLSALTGAEVAAVAAWEDVGDGPCSVAARVASANGASIEKCELQGSDCRVELVRRVAIVGIPVQVRARARAGVEP